MDYIHLLERTLLTPSRVRGHAQQSMVTLPRLPRHALPKNGQGPRGGIKLSSGVKMDEFDGYRFGL